jgi:hypothetical protein
MSEKNHSRRSEISPSSHRRGRPVSDEAAKRAFAERIARQVLSMTSEEVDEFIVERGLSHLADPERMADLLNIAVNMPADRRFAISGPDAQASSSDIKDMVFEVRDRQLPPPPRKH